MILPALEKARTGDMSAFGRLYDLSYDRIYRYVFHRTLDTSMTEDIVSDVFSKAMKYIGKFRGGSEGEYYSWVFQIAYTTIIDHQKRGGEVESLETLEWEGSTEDADTLDIRDKLDEVLSYMKTLSDKEQSIITMRIWDDLSYEEISKITGESEANIRKIISRTLGKIVANVSALSLIIFCITHVW